MKYNMHLRSFNVSLNAIKLFLVVVGIFIFSLLFGPFYHESDQNTYRKAYHVVYGLGLIEGYSVYGQYLTGEFVHYVIVWIGSNLGFEKNFIMAIANSTLAYLIMKLCFYWRVSFYIVITLVFTNFYLLVLYFTAERLKFGFIFLMLSLLYSKQGKSSVAFAITAVFAHAQQILIYISIVFSAVMISVSSILKDKKIKYKEIALLAGAIIVAGVIFYFLGDVLLYKFKYYYAAQQKYFLLIIWKPLLFLILTLLYSTERLKVVSAFIILILATSLVGPERVTIISYSFFMYYGLQYKGGVNAGVILTSCYYFFKSIFFIVDVLETGQGFSLL